MTYKIRRALLFMPGDDRHKIEKGAALNVDAVIMDLEDGVALNHKAAARQTIVEALHEVDFGHTERLVRVNPVGSGFDVDDLALILPARPDGIVLPKAESGDQLAALDEHIGTIEQQNGWEAGGIVLFAIIETATGVVNLREIASSTSRLAGLMFGAEDLAGDIGATRTPDGHEVAYARSATVIHAKAAGLQAIDTPYIDLHNLDGLRSQTQQAMTMGYDGKLAIHPKQVDVIQAVFTPDAESIARAKQLIDAHERQQAAGTGVFALHGKMVDRPMVRAAERVLARARAAGIKVE
ncbi:MAG: CoA ester lyase [Chloroflexi bacterium]|nr:MAG: CoA ester lyase [Chloroflexota bacterium]